jgi:CheY-like chemotaxis protein
MIDPKHPDSVEGSSRRRSKILIVDDSEIVCETVAMMLEERGYDVVSLANLFQFVQTLEIEKPDLVLVDVMMPAITGDKLVEIARRHERGKACPMVLFSDKKAEHLERLAQACGAAGFIQKTNDAEVLARAVQTYLRKRGK